MRTETEWTNIVDASLNDLSKPDIPYEELDKILGFGVFSLHSPNSQNLVGFVVESL